MKSLHECFYGFVFTKSLIISIYQFLQDAIKNAKQHTLLTEYWIKTTVIYKTGKF